MSATSPGQFPEIRLRRGRRTANLRRLVAETELSSADLIYPVFVLDGEGIEEPVASMPGISRKSIDNLLAELAEAPLIFRKGRTGHERVWEHLKQVEQERGYKLNVVMHSESTQAVKAAVRSGMGLGILYKDHVEQETKIGELKRIKIPELKMKLTSFIVHLREASLSPHAQDFLTLLREWSKKKQVAKDLPMVA